MFVNPGESPEESIGVLMNYKETSVFWRSSRTIWKTLLLLFNFFREINTW